MTPEIPIAEIFNPVIFVSENEEDQAYFDLIKRYWKNYYVFKSAKEALRQFEGSGENNINRTIFIISDEITEIPIQKFIKLIRDFIGTTQILIFSKNSKVEYVKEVMKLGVDEYLKLPNMDALTDKEKKKEWEMLMLQSFSKLCANIGITDVIKKLDEVQRENWRAELIKDFNFKIQNYIQEDNRKRQQKGQEIRSIERFASIEEILEFILKETNKKIEQRQKATILVVEDDADNRGLISMVLSQFFNIFEAENGQKALEIVENNPKIDLALLDIMLPDIKGTELIMKMKNLSSTIEFIMLTGYTNVDFISHSLRDGAFDFLNKPFNQELVLKKIKNALDKRYYSTLLFDLWFSMPI